jgi:hypothetical protein
VLLGVLLSERLTGSLGSPVSRRDLGLSAGPCGFSSSAVHRNLPTAASSSRELSASSRVLRPATCPPYRERPCDLSRPASAFRGVLSLIAASTGGVHHCAGSPDPALKFPPRRFSRPRGFAPPPAFAGLFHPAATSRVCPPGVCPSPRSRTGFPRPIHALLPFKHSDLRLPAPASAPSASGPCSPRRMRCRSRRFRPRPIRAPHGLSLPPPGLPPAQRASAFTPAPPMTFDCDEPTAAGPRRFAVARIGLPGTRLPTRSRFLA